MKESVLAVDRDSRIYIEAGKIWYDSYWTDGHNDSATHKVIEASEARQYANSLLKELEDDREKVEKKLKSVLDKIEVAKKYI